MSFIPNILHDTCLTAAPRRIATLAAMIAAILPLKVTAAPSRLASGKWVRISVSETGMQLVSNSQLRSMGLDPARTRVYGAGGRMVPESFPQDMPDDLPLLPSVATASGIVFFGTDNITWSADTDGSYTRSMHPYCAESYYFLSDTDPGEEPDMPVVESASPSSAARSVFRARTLHEEELFPPSNSGRVLLGEDFRSTRTRTFQFNLPDNADGEATAEVRFAARTLNGQSSLLFHGNGVQLDASTSDRIAGVTNSEVFMNTTTTRKQIGNASDRLSLQIGWSATGSITLARLDWIIVEYNRSLALNDGELYFYGDCGTAAQPATMAVSGCSADTRIWDVTSPWAPAEVRFTLDGTTARFTPAGGGYREFVAFNPSSVRRAVATAGTVANQDIHSLETPDMVIITPALFRSAAERLADMHRRHDGMVVHVLDPQLVYNEFSSGSADPGAFRKMLKMWQLRDIEEGNSGRNRYCLMMGRPTYDNKAVTAPIRNRGFKPLPIWQSDAGTSAATSYSTDDYVGMLDHDIRDIKYGTIHVPVGRLPVTTAAEADALVTKIIDYVENPEYGSWRNHVMLVADDGDRAEHLNQSKNVHRYMMAGGNGSDFVYDLLYFDAYQLASTASGHTYPEVTKALLNKWNEGVGFINYIGHANPMSWSHEKVLQWEDINSFANERLPMLYAATCEFARWDADEPGGGEIMLLNPSGGYVAGIIPSRSVYISLNGVLSNNTMARLFERDATGAPKRFGDVMIQGKNLQPGDDNKLRYCFLGDPAIRVCSPTHSVRLEAVDGEAPSLDSTVIAARQRVTLEGTVLNPDGTPAEDFDGVVEVTLYDAEVAVETNGNGDSGIVSNYNDRSVRLAVQSGPVSAGHWELTLNVPTEIQNNFSPALVSMYAWSSAGTEANGACTDLYVYGYDEDAPGDAEGPVIEMFTINHEGFMPGDVSHSTPVVLASVSDESGINVSNVSIGHDMSLIVDGRTLYDDLASRFVPDPARSGAGSLVYPLENIEPGEHSVEFKVWDNAGNSSTASLTFQVAVRKSAAITSFTAVPLDGTTALRVALDRPNANVEALFEIFDLNGAPVWCGTVSGNSKTSNLLETRWNRCDDAGRALDRGIYLCRATVTTPDGAVSHVTNKVAVSAK